MLPHFILVLFVVCTVGICEFCPYSFIFFFFRVSILLLWAPSAAYNNLIDTIPSISLYMPAQIRGSCGHLKGKYDSHSSCINCAGCSRYNSCVKCQSWSDSIWVLAEKCRSFRGRQMGKKKESRGKQQKGFLSKRSSRTDSHDDPAGSSVVSLDDDSPSGEPAPVLSRSSSGGDLRLGDSSVKDLMEQRVRRLTWAAGRPTVPPPPDPTLGIWIVSMGFRLRPLTLRPRLSV